MIKSDVIVDDNIEAADFGNCSAIIDGEDLNDDEANSELNNTMIRVGDKKAAVNQSTVSINDVSIELSQTEIPQ